MPNELLPCPFCGGPATSDVENNGIGTFWVVCDNIKDRCGCEGPYQSSPEQAIEAWNRRASLSDAERHERTVPDIALIKDLQRHIEERGATTEIGQDIQCAIEVIRTLSAAPPPPAAAQETVAVKIKPLEWVRPAFTETLKRGETIVGTYRVWTHREANGKWFWKLEAAIEIKYGEHDTEDAAKAAAQSDYEQRIRSALSPSQSETDREETDA